MATKFVNTYFGPRTAGTLSGPPGSSTAPATSPVTSYLGPPPTQAQAVSTYGAYAIDQLRRAPGAASDRLYQTYLAMRNGPEGVS